MSDFVNVGKISKICFIKVHTGTHNSEFMYSILFLVHKQ